jgi:hypothetical protein
MIYLKSVLVGLAFTFGALYATALLGGLVLGLERILEANKWKWRVFGFRCVPPICDCRACWFSSLDSSGHIDGFQNELSNF